MVKPGRFPAITEKEIGGSNVVPGKCPLCNNTNHSKKELPTEGTDLRAITHNNNHHTLIIQSSQKEIINQDRNGCKEWRKGVGKVGEREENKNKHTGQIKRSPTSTIRKLWYKQLPISRPTNHSYLPGRSDRASNKAWPCRGADHCTTVL